LKELIINYGLELIFTAVAGIGGYFLKGMADKINKKREDKELTERLIKNHADLLSAKSISISRDITAYIHFYNFINEHINEEGFKESVFYQEFLEIKELSQQRLLENIESVLTIVTDNYDANYKNVKDIIEKYKNDCINLRRVLTLKSDDNQKVSLLKQIEENIRNNYVELMKNIQNLYK
jgi:beta-mannanase